MVSDKSDNANGRLSKRSETGINEQPLKGRLQVREGTIKREMWGTRALVALGAIATLAVILWAFLIRQAHPVGSLQYYYLVVFPNLITLLGIIAFVIVIVMFARRRRDRRS